ncbi:MAG: flagellar basal body-associated FliL family protein [Gammaproteobacteria bacterium]
MADDELILPPQSPSKTRWIILGSVLLLSFLVIGTFYAMGIIHAPAFLTENSESDDPSEPGRAEPTTYYPLAPFTVNFRQGDGARYLQVAISVSLVDSEDILAAIQKHEPAIRNNLLLMLSAQDPVELRSREGKEKLRKLVLQEIQSILKQRAGQGGIEEIFFTDFVMQ